MIGTQVLVGLTVALGAAALFAMMRAGSFDVAIRALEAPSNADIYPLENRMLAYFAMAPVLGCSALLFAGAAARRMVRFRTFVLSLVIWTLLWTWGAALLLTVFQGGAWFGLGAALSNASGLLGLWLYLPPVAFLLGFWLIARSERMGDTQ